MRHLVKHPTPGAWYRTYLDDDPLAIGIHIRSVDKPALFDTLYQSGYFDAPLARAREKFLLSPLRPPCVSGRRCRQCRKAYHSELEARRAVNHDDFTRLSTFSGTQYCGQPPSAQT